MYLFGYILNLYNFYNLLYNSFVYLHHYNKLLFLLLIYDKLFLNSFLIFLIFQIHFHLEQMEHYLNCHLYCFDHHLLKKSQNFLLYHLYYLCFYLLLFWGFFPLSLLLIFLFLYLIHIFWIFENLIYFLIPVVEVYIFQYHLIFFRVFF